MENTDNEKYLLDGDEQGEKASKLIQLATEFMKDTQRAKYTLSTEMDGIHVELSFKAEIME